MPGILGGDIRCPIARSLDVLGDRWTFMIVRDALAGSTRFGQFHASLGVPRDVLTTRLATLVEGGVFEKRSYRAPGERPRDEYILTDAGHELSIILRALGQWGERNRPIAQKSSLAFVEEATGEPVDVSFTTTSDRVLDLDAVVVHRS